ncbi:MAG: hypothetical protein JTT11_09260, partial [Candidatus Brockarchaeota archaeon]|nr:hypothetical protein [Candidatus Brockarchaeota archaeon]
MLKDRQSGWMPIHVLAESSFCERKVELMLKFGYKPTYHATRGFRNHAESAREWCRATQEGILEALSKGVGVHAREVRLAEPSLKLKGIVDQLETYGKRGKAVANAIGEERKVHNCEHVYMTISGGRKDMSIMMALVAQVAGVDGVYHIIHKNVAKYNVMLERMRHDISELAKSGNPRSYYEARLGDFEQLMF